MNANVSENMSRFCIICGTPITVRYSMGRGHNVSICKDGSCVKKYMTEFAQSTKRRVAGFCGRCGKPMLLSFLHAIYRHLSKEACEAAPNYLREHTPRIKKKREKPPVKKPPRVYLKPWKDPQSLFCSPKLGEIVGKEIPRGVECGG